MNSIHIWTSLLITICRLDDGTQYLRHTTHSLQKSNSNKGKKYYVNDKHLRLYFSLSRHPTTVNGRPPPSPPSGTAGTEAWRWPSSVAMVI